VLTYILVVRHNVLRHASEVRYLDPVAGLFAVSGAGPRSELLANWLLTGVSIYVACGIVFAVLFLIFGLRRMDAASIGAPISFKLVILPGLIILWPFVMIRWFFRGHE